MAYKNEMEALVITSPELHSVFDPNTSNQVTHLAYEAEVQYKTKQPQRQLILCGQMDTVRVGEPVLIVYHTGMRCYQHSRYVSLSNGDNCSGGFYYTNGQLA